MSAQSSEAQVVGLANVATETVNTIKQAREFGIVPGRPAPRGVAS